MQKLLEKSNSFLKRSSIINKNSFIRNSFEKYSKNKFFKHFNNFGERSFSFLKKKIKFTTYKILFYIFAFIFIIKIIKYLFKKMIYGDSEDDKYNNLLKSLNQLQKQNEELRIMNQRLLESKNR